MLTIIVSGSIESESAVVTVAPVRRSPRPAVTMETELAEQRIASVKGGRGADINVLAAIVISTP
jgi:hypothetical protein